MEETSAGVPLQVLLYAAGALGAWLLAVAVIRTCRFFFTQFFRQPHDLLLRYSGRRCVGGGIEERSWAVVTGASGGIGRGFAVELARRGFNICLISRSMDRLQDAGDEVQRVNPKTKVKLVVADFRLAHDHIHRTVPTYEMNDDEKERQREDDEVEEEKGFTSSSSPFWTSLLRDLEDISDDIAILVNNVGINHTEPFSTIAEDFLFDIIAVNCTAQMMLTRKLINKMLRRRRVVPGSNNNTTTPARGAVISISSVAGQRPLLYLSPYSATKAFNDFFSRSLALEYGDQIDFLSLRAGYVASNMSKLTETGGFVLDRYECAKGCLEKLGYVTETYGDPRHAVYARSFFLIPERLMTLRRRQRLEEKAQLSKQQQPVPHHQPKLKTQ